MSWLNFVSFVGLFALCGIAWVGSENRRRLPWKVILWGIGLQLFWGLLIFQVPQTRFLMGIVSDNINAVLDATEAGARFLFGDLLVPNSSLTPGPVLAGRWIARAITPAYVPVLGDRLSPENLNLGYVFAFRGLPSIVFFSALMALLYNLKLIQPLVAVFAKVFRKLMGLSGPEALSGAANIFVGIESAIVVRPFLASMSRSELCAVLAACYGSAASTVLALYGSLLRPEFPNIVGHLVSASFLAIPACFVMAKILVPETEQQTGQPDREKLEDLSHPQNLKLSPSGLKGGSESSSIVLDSIDELETLSPMESLIVGATDGVKLAVSIAAVLIAVLGLVALVNLFFENLAALSGSSNEALSRFGNVFKIMSVQNILGALFLPLTAITGISSQWPELWQSSVLIGSRLVATEIPSYLELARLSAQGVISPRALVIVSYILCGFAHLPSLGIFVGGFVALAPSRRKDISELAWKALWAATLATLMVGCIAGVFFAGNASILGR